MKPQQPLVKLNYCIPTILAEPTLRLSAKRICLNAYGLDFIRQDISLLQ